MPAKRGAETDYNVKTETAESHRDFTASGPFVRTGIFLAIPRAREESPESQQPRGLTGSRAKHLPKFYI